MRKKARAYASFPISGILGKLLVVPFLVVTLMLSLGAFPIISAASGASDLPSPTSEDLILYQQTIQSYIIDWIRDYYSRYYQVNHIEGTVESLQTKDGQIRAIVKVHLNKTLKAGEVDKLSFVRGMLKAIGLTSYNYQANQEQKVNSILALHPRLAVEKATEVIKVLDEKYKELANYIGVADDSYMTLKMEAEFRQNGCENVRLYLQQQDGYVPAEQKLPSNSEEMEKDGFSFMASLVIAQTIISPSLYPGYDRIKARDYANNWTSNSTELCPHGLAYRTISYWNNSKWPYYSNACHADCADYVSQALNAGGIPIDPGKWERLKDSGNGWAWTSVPALKAYMITQKSYWKTSTWASASAGGVIVIPNYHVMMIVKNDTVERLYSAHTNDKKQCPYSNHTDWEYYILW